jgi:hypothetical protein
MAVLWYCSNSPHLFQTKTPAVPGFFDEDLRRGRDSNPRYKFKLVQRFSKPALSATQAPLHFRWDGKIKRKISNKNQLHSEIFRMFLPFLPGKRLEPFGSGSPLPSRAATTGPYRVIKICSLSFAPALPCSKFQRWAFNRCAPCIKICRKTFTHLSELKVPAQRRRLIDGIMIGFKRTAFPAGRFPQTDLTGQSLFSLFAGTVAAGLKRKNPSRQAGRDRIIV